MRICNSCYYFAAIVIIGLSVRPTLQAQEGTSRHGLEFSGSMYADLGMYHYIVDGKRDSGDFSGINVLSMRFINANRAHGKIDGNFELLLPYGAAAKKYVPSLQSEIQDSISQAVEKVASRYFYLYTNGSSPLLLDMRTFYFEFYLPFADIAFGRQIINFGYGIVFSPLDVFSSLEINDINFRRSGSDVALVRVPVGPLTGVDVIIEAPFKENEHSTAIKYFSTFAGWDMNLVGLYRHKNEEAIIGITFKGDAFLGIHGELVEHLVNGFNNQYFECMLGADYSLKNRWFFDIEYFFKDQKPATLSKWSRHNGYTSIRYTPNELMQFSLSGIYQFEKESTIATLSWYYSLLQNVDLTTYIRGYNNVGISEIPDLQYDMRFEVKF